VVADIIGPDFVFVLFALLSLALVIWAIVDVAQRPPSILSSGAKTAWIIGLILGTLLFGVVGLIVALVYLVGVRPRLTRPTG
jgi:uncharacterized membrane protein